MLVSSSGAQISRQRAQRDRSERREPGRHDSDAPARRAIGQIHGRDHDLQHIRRGGIDYFYCGAGSQVRPVQPIDGTLFCRAQPGFAAVSLDAESLTLEMRDYAGASLYRSAG